MYIQAHMSCSARFESMSALHSSIRDRASDDTRESCGYTSVSLHDNSDKRLRRCLILAAATRTSWILKAEIWRRFHVDASANPVR